LELELTESLFAKNVNVTGAMLNELRMHIGLKLSIDDFGTGYSSLSYLKRFPLDVLELDRSFIRGVVIDYDESDLHTTRARRYLPKGVQNEEQRACLCEYGCDRVQGYYFGEPLPAEDFSELPKREKVLLSVSTRG
jgi:EAL domain-containing protein (putative c-di-GMP-specific phosphodiesterase class I)